MGENFVNLNFKGDVTRLAGFPYGESVYREQVQGKIDLDSTVVIHFPDNIVKVASSFVQGFFSSIVNQIGYDAIFKKVKIESTHGDLTDSIMKNLL